MTLYIYQEETGYDEAFEAATRKAAYDWAANKLRAGEWGQHDAGFAGRKVRAKIYELDGYDNEVWSCDVEIDIEPDCEPVAERTRGRCRK